MDEQLFSEPEATYMHPPNKNGVCLKSAYMFNIGDVLRFCITDETCGAKQRLLSGGILKEYVNHQVCADVGGSTPDFVLAMKKHIEPRNDVYVLDDSFAVGNGYLYGNGSYKLARWNFELIVHERDPIQLNLCTNLSARFLISGFFTDFLIQLALLRRGFSIVHASGITDGSESTLLSGRGGSGKTTLALKLLNTSRKWKYLGDDFIIMKDGSSFPYITPLNLFSYNLSPYLSSVIGWQKRAEISLSRIIYTITNGYAKFLVKVNPTEFMKEQVGSPSRVRNVFILFPVIRDGFKGMQIDRIDKETAIRHLVSNMILDSPVMPRALLDYSFVNPHDYLGEYWDNYSRTLDTNLLAGVNYYSACYHANSNWSELASDILGLISHGM